MDKLRPDRNIGKNIRALRMEKGLTQEQVVARLQVLGCDKITRNVYSRYEINSLNIRVSELIGLKEIFNCTYDEFFKDLQI